MINYLLRSHLYKIIFRLDCHIQNTIAGKYRSACAKHKTIFLLQISTSIK